MSTPVNPTQGWIQIEIRVAAPAKIYEWGRRSPLGRQPRRVQTFRVDGLEVGDFEPGVHLIPVAPGRRLLQTGVAGSGGGERVEVDVEPGAVTAVGFRHGYGFLMSFNRFEGPPRRAERAVFRYWMWHDRELIWFTVGLAATQLLVCAPGGSALLLRGDGAKPATLAWLPVSFLIGFVGAFFALRWARVGYRTALTIDTSGVSFVTHHLAGDVPWHMIVGATVTGDGDDRKSRSVLLRTIAPGGAAAQVEIPLGRVLVTAESAKLALRAYAPEGVSID